MTTTKSGRPYRQTCVEEGSELKGTLSSSCPVVVRGVLEGEIDAPSLTIDPGGRVVGSVRVQRLISEGSLSGNVQADDVTLSGSVHSESVIRARRLEVKREPGQPEPRLRFTDCVLEIGDDPAARLSEPRPVAPSAQAGATEEAAAASEEQERPAAKAEGSSKKKKSKGADSGEESGTGERPRLSSGA